MMMVSHFSFYILYFNYYLSYTVFLLLTAHHSFEATRAPCFPAQILAVIGGVEFWSTNLSLFIYLIFLSVFNFLFTFGWFTCYTVPSYVGLSIYCLWTTLRITASSHLVNLTGAPSMGPNEIILCSFSPPTPPCVSNLMLLVNHCTKPPHHYIEPLNIHSIIVYMGVHSVEICNGRSAGLLII